MTFGDSALLAADAEHRQRVLGSVGPREDRLAVELEQILGRCAVADEIGGDARQADVEPRALAEPCQLAEELLGVRRRIVAPAVLFEQRRRDEVAELVAERAAGFGLHLDAAERSRRQLGARAS